MTSHNMEGQPMSENGDVQPGGKPGGDDALVLALATGSTIDEAAGRAGCSPRTVSRRLADAEFSRRVSTVRGQLFAVAVGRLCNNAALAADKLVALLDSEQDHVAFASAKAILELGTKLREAGELEGRLTQLENVAQQNGRIAHTSARFGGARY